MITHTGSRKMNLLQATCTGHKLRGWGQGHPHACYKTGSPPSVNGDILPVVGVCVSWCGPDGSRLSVSIGGQT